MSSERLTLIANQPQIKTQDIARREFVQRAYVKPLEEADLKPFTYQSNGRTIHTIFRATDNGVHQPTSLDQMPIHLIQNGTQVLHVNEGMLNRLGTSPDPHALILIQGSSTDQKFAAIAYIAFQIAQNGNPLRIHPDVPARIRRQIENKIIDIEEQRRCWS